MLLSGPTPLPSPRDRKPGSGPFALRRSRSRTFGVYRIRKRSSRRNQAAGRDRGYITETAGGVVISGLNETCRKWLIKSDELTVAYVTGNGLKTIEVVESVVETITIKPTYGSFEDAMAAR